MGNICCELSSENEEPSCKPSSKIEASNSDSSSENEETDLLKTSKIKIGDRFIQIGDWRIGDANGNHLSITHFSKYGHFTSVIFRKDGTVHNGPRTAVRCKQDQFTTWNRQGFVPNQVYFGDRFIQIGEWRLGDNDGRHFSISHKDGQTAMIYREDGTVHNGPRNGHGNWQLNCYEGRPDLNNSNIKFGDRFL